jgi:hypothetical protein
VAAAVFTDVELELTDVEALAVVEAAKATAGTLTPIAATKASATRDLLANFFIVSPLIRTVLKRERFKRRKVNCEIGVRGLLDH